MGGSTRNDAGRPGGTALVKPIIKRCNKKDSNDGRGDGVTPGAFARAVCDGGAGGGRARVRAGVRCAVARAPPPPAPPMLSSDCLLFRDFHARAPDAKKEEFGPISPAAA